jgi:hypothetical protein
MIAIRDPTKHKQLLELLCKDFRAYFVDREPLSDDLKASFTSLHSRLPSRIRIGKGPPCHTCRKKPAHQHCNLCLECIFLDANAMIVRILLKCFSKYLCY